MIVGISVFELHLPGAQSLKQKRKVVKSLVERIHQRLKVSIIESDHHDLHQRAQIALALVAQNEGDAERLFDRVRDLVDLSGDAMLTDWRPELIDVAE
ncbi:MAG: DUF503 domain-containing protein [Acidobacteriota bacterium]